MRAIRLVPAWFLLAVPLAAQAPKGDGPTLVPGGGAIGGGIRITAAQWTAMPTPPGVSAATGVASFSSEYGNGWHASSAIGAPDVYPRHGDIPGAWAPATTTSERDELVLRFNGNLTQEIWIFETYGVGGLFQVDDASGGVLVPLWHSAPGPVSEDAVRVLRITLLEPRPISALRLSVNAAAVGSYPEIDAVVIVPTLAGPQLATPKVQ